MLKWIALLALAVCAPAQGAVLIASGTFTLKRVTCSEQPCEPLASSALESFSYYAETDVNFPPGSRSFYLLDNGDQLEAIYTGMKLFRFFNDEGLNIQFIPGSGVRRSWITLAEPFRVRAYYETSDFTLTIDGSPVPIGVPEPSTWALLMLGFGAIGAGLRRNRPSRAVGSNAGRCRIPRSS